MSPNIVTVYVEETSIISIACYMVFSLTVKIQTKLMHFHLMHSAMFNSVGFSNCT